MKKLLLFCLLLSPALVIAQTTEPVKTTTAQTHEVYCVLTADDKMLSTTKVNISVNYGQEAKDDQRNQAEGAKAATYITVPDALNYMALQGWTVINGYVTSMRNVNTAHILLKRTVTTDSK